MPTEYIPLPFDKISEIFPSTKTGTMNKLITENSLTRFINRLLDVDSYIISSEFGDNLINGELIAANSNDYISLTDILDKDLEFSIRGYYFNLGTYEEFIDNLSNLEITIADKESLLATIYVSNDTDYPELYGQNTVESKELTGTSGNITFDNSITITSISNIQLYDEDGKISAITPDMLSVNSNHILSYTSAVGADPVLLSWDDQSETAPIPGITRVTYTVTTVNQCLYLSVLPAPSVSNTSSTGTQTRPEVIQEATDSYSLILLRKEGSNYVIPLNSLHKFDTISISTIDGGYIAEN